MVNLTNCATVMKNWVKRRRLKGIEPTADEIHERIKHNWPNLKDCEAEAVFQEAN